MTVTLKVALEKIADRRSAEGVAHGKSRKETCWTVIGARGGPARQLGAWYKP